MREFNAREAFGFGEEGYITLLYGDEGTLNDMRKQNHYIWYNPFFGHYIPSFHKIQNIPTNITTKQLRWEQVKDPSRENRLLPAPEFFTVMRAFNGFINNGAYQGEVGKYIERYITVKEDTSKTTKSHSYIFEDDEKNIYIWDTKSVNLPIGSSMRMKMKVKNHQLYLDNNATIVWYCKMI